MLLRRRFAIAVSLGDAILVPGGAGIDHLAKGEIETQHSPLIACRQEARAVIFGCIDDLIQKTGLNMRKVDFLVINCSLFSPTPSLCAMVATHYKVMYI